jgi:plastocyanin
MSTIGPFHSPSFLKRRLLVGLAILPAAGTADGTGLARSRVPRAASLAAATTGRVAGTVELSSALSARRPGFRIYSDLGPGSVRPEAPRGDSTTELRNVVVYLQPDDPNVLSASDTTAAQMRNPDLSQRGERFVPHLLPVVRGATVDFPNRDDVYHNVFSLSGAKPFDLGRYPKGTSRSVTFRDAGTVPVFCHIHSDMSAVVLVLENRYFVTPDPTGRFSIDGVPPGEYTVVGWHERIRPIQRRVHVTAGGTASVDFNIPLPAQERPRP